MRIEDLDEFEGLTAEKLIEEAGRWAESIRRSPGKGTAGEDLYGAKLLTDLATALRAECKRVEVLSRDVSRISGEREHWQAAEERARQDRDEYAAANLAANKRIVELEQETDGLHDALRTCDESRKELIDGLKTARDTLDLGKRLIQALQHERDTARAELARLTTPRPIAEAPRDGSPVLCEVPGYGRRHLFWNEAWYLVGAPEYTYAPVSFYPSLPAEGGPRAEKVRS